jgi:hypothetical protein
MRRSLVALQIFVLIPFISACPGDPPPSVPVPVGALVGCVEAGQPLPITIRATGSTPMTPLSGSLNENGAAVTWNAGTSSGTNIDGASVDMTPTST